MEEASWVKAPWRSETALSLVARVAWRLQKEVVGVRYHLWDAEEVAYG